MKKCTRIIDGEVKSFMCRALFVLAIVFVSMLPRVVNAGIIYGDWIAANGGDAVMSGGTSGVNYPAGYGPENAFDGQITASEEYRYLGELNSDPAKSAYIVYGADIAGKTFTMTGYSICQCTVGNYSNDRAPTSWTLYGSDSVSGPWTEIESRSDVEWSGATGATVAIPSDCWRDFELDTPQTYKFYKILFTASRASDINWKVGVMEIQFRCGTFTYVPPHDEGGLLVPGRGVSTFDETAYDVTMENALSFTGFSSLGDSSTFFKGGWWDFGATDNAVNFWSDSDAASNRYTEFSDGAVVTNVGTVWIGGTSGNSNTMFMKDKSEFYAARVMFGKAVKGQKSGLWITDGSLLSTTGMISMSENLLSGSYSTDLTGNLFVISNSNSRLKCTTLYVGRTLSGRKGGTGGNTFIVTDGGKAEMSSLSFNSSCYHGVSNVVQVSKNGYLKTGNIAWATDGYYGGERPNYDRFEILDGGVVSNTGAFTMGSYRSNSTGHLYMLVSNGVFYTAGKIDATHGLFRTKNSTIIVSGKDAKFQVGKYDYNTPLFNGYATDCTFIIENGANIILPIDIGYSYTGSAIRDTIIVRTGAIYNGNVKMSNFYNVNGITNSFVVESDAIVTSPSFRANSMDGRVTVSNAQLIVTNSGDAFKCGKQDGETSAVTGFGTNVLVEVKGDRPSIRVPNGNMAVSSSTTLKFYLPSEGYEDSANPPLYVAGDMVFDETDNAIVIEGAAALVKYHEKILKKSGEYVLVDAGDIIATKWESILSTAKSNLPAGMSLSSVETDSRRQLILKVSGGKGLALIIR